MRHRFIKAVWIGENYYLPGTFVPKDISDDKLTELIDEGSVAEYKHDKPKKVKVKKVTNGDRQNTK